MKNYLDFKNITEYEKFDVAVLGLGGMGKTHVGAAKSSPHVNRIYGYEPDQARREERAKELEIIPATLEEILADPSIPRRSHRKNPPPAL